ncbi:MAG: hypothetical protein E8A49_19955 [Phenylobacterium sp.]|nr:MAG: hypothetical protein E8A49_19955 [Phenylobacterium sp.]
MFDQWAQVMSTMTGMATFNPAKGPDFQVSESQVADLRAATGVAAIPEIVRRARKTRIVILDENHLEPRSRAFGLQVARALRPLGYTVLAAEALHRGADDGEVQAKMDKLSADGYVRQSSGYYLDDPVFADFLRQSLALGYRLVSYEFGGDFVSEAQRDQDQTDNLVRRAVRKYPNAKILIYSGEHHLAKRPIAIEGGQAEWMAQRLKQATGIDPLTIDQGGLTPLPMNRSNADLYGIAVRKAHGRSVVLMRDGKPLTVGLLAGSIDLQVIHPQSATVDGRPGWLAQMGRKPRPIPPSLLPKSGVRLVQAFVAREADDTIPIDQVLVTAGQPAPALMLPPVAVRYVAKDVKAEWLANLAGEKRP